MNFKLWIESQIIQIPISDLLIFRKSLIQAFSDFKDGRESRTDRPIEVWQTEDGKYQLIDGYHRIVAALIHGQKIIKAEIVGKGYSDYWSVAKPRDQFHYRHNMTYQDLQDLADKELLRDLDL